MTSLICLKFLIKFDYFFKNIKRCLNITKIINLFNFRIQYLTRQVGECHSRSQAELLKRGMSYLNQNE